MAKAKRLYGCTECGATFPKWAGQCGECGQCCRYPGHFWIVANSAKRSVERDRIAALGPVLTASRALVPAGTGDVTLFDPVGSTAASMPNS